MNAPDMSSKNMRAQARLLRRARKEVHTWRMIELGRLQYQYLWNFLKTHHHLVIGLCALLLVRALIEAVLIIFGRYYISFDIPSFIHRHFIPVIAILICVFLLVSFFALKYERSLVVLFANRIRRRLFASYLYRHSASVLSRSRAELMAQISYHLPLVSLGVSNVFFGISRFVLYGIMIGVLAHLGGFSVWWISLAYITTAVAVAALAYVFSRYWASQEVTYYSRIMRDIETNASDTDFIARFGQERRVLAAFDRLVDFDSFFRIRRDIFMRIGYAFIFVLVLVFSLLVHMAPDRFLSFIGSSSAGHRLVLIFLFVYASRALTEACKVGLYLFPARLGLFLTVRPVGLFSRPYPRVVLTEAVLRFHARKIKLFPEGTYYREMNFVFHPGDRILIEGENLIGKSSLAKIFTGVSAHTPRAITVTAADTRLDFSQWKNHIPHGIYFFDPTMRIERSLIEFILGRVKEDISTEAFAAALLTMNQYPAIVALVAPDGNYNVPAASVLSNPIQAFALHVLHCIATTPVFIVIDNFWLDLNYPRIHDMIQTLSRALSRSIMVIFSRVSTDSLPYTQHYVLANTITRLT